MESKWSRLRMILTVTCGNESYQCHITWLGRCRWHSTWSFSGSVFQRLLNLLEQYDIVDQTFAVCCDTTSSNTSVFSGAIVLLCTILYTPLLWFLCRRHMLAVNISHFIGSFTREKTKAPWGVVCQTSEGMAISQEWDWKRSRLGHPCTKLPVKLCSLGRGPGPWEYKKLCELFVGLDAPVFHYHQPGPCH